MSEIFNSLAKATLVIFIAWLSSTTNWYINQTPNMFNEQNLIFVIGIGILGIWAVYPLFIKSNEEKKE